jgi:RecB family exonuclease
MQPVEVAGVRLSGLADRIDRRLDGSATWVIDYKTGSASSFAGLTEVDPFAGGTKLQLPAYLAGDGAGGEKTGLYWLISRRAGFEQKAYTPTPATDTRFSEILGAILDGIRAGAFPAVSGEEQEHYNNFENCRYCDFDRLCSRRRDHEMGAKREDAAFAPWHEVGRRARGEQ